MGVLSRPLSDSNPRLACLAGLLASLAFAVSEALGYHRSSFTFTALAAFLLGLPLAAYFAGIAFFPEATGRLLTLRSRFNPDEASHVAAGALVAFALTVTSARPLITLAYRLEGGVPAIPASGAEVLAGAAVLALLTLGATVLWMTTVERAATVSDLVRRLRVPGAAPGKAAAIGAGVGIASVILATALVLLWNLAASAFGEPPAEETVAQGLALALGLGGIVLAAAIAAVHEEVFFRGFLLPRIGLGLQAGLFAVGHAAYGTAPQVVVPLLLGLGWGWLFLRTRSLLAPVVAHFLFNVVGFLSAGGWLG